MIDSIRFTADCVNWQNSLFLNCHTVSFNWPELWLREKYGRRPVNGHCGDRLRYVQQWGGKWLLSNIVKCWLGCRLSKILSIHQLPTFPSVTLTLIQPVSQWTHWATLRCHSDLFRAATSASSQVIPILNKSLLTVLFQLVHGQPGPLLNPGTSQCNACWGMHWWSIRITCHKL